MTRGLFFRAARAIDIQMPNFRLKKKSIIIEVVAFSKGRFRDLRVSLRRSMASNIENDLLSLQREVLLDSDSVIGGRWAAREREREEPHQAHLDSDRGSAPSAHLTLARIKEGYTIGCMCVFNSLKIQRPCK